jgi:hypothetical protein
MWNVNVETWKYHPFAGEEHYTEEREYGYTWVIIHG